MVLCARRAAPFPRRTCPVVHRRVLGTVGFGARKVGDPFMGLKENTTGSRTLFWKLSNSQWACQTAQSIVVVPWPSVGAGKV